MTLLDNYKSILFVSILWRHTYSASPSAPDPIRVLPDPGWFSGFRTKQKKKASFEVQSPGSDFLVKNRIRNPAYKKYF